MKKKSDVLFFQPNDDYSGSARVLATVIEKQFSDVPVTIISSSGLKGFLSELPNVRIVHYWNPRFLTGSFSAVRSIIWRTCAYTLALVYGFHHKKFYINTIVPYYAAKVGSFLGKEITYHVHEKFVVYSKGNRQAEAVFTQTKAHRIYVSHYLCSQYDNTNALSVEVKYNKLSKSFIDKVHVTPLENRNCNSLIMISTLTKDKGALEIVELASKMPMKNFTYIVNASDGQIKDFYKDMSLPSNLRLIPRTSNIHPYLASADLLLNLSSPFFLVETFGMTILEAMAYGIPAIAPNVGGPLELVVNGENGYCIDVSDVEIVKEKIEFILCQDNYEHFVRGALKRFEYFK